MLTEKIKPPETQADKMLKDAELAKSIRDISSVCQHLFNLLGRIDGQRPKTDEKMQEPPDPTLSQTISEAPGFIREEVDKCHNIIQEIENLLF